MSLSLLDPVVRNSRRSIFCDKCAALLEAKSFERMLHCAVVLTGVATYVICLFCCVVKDGVCDASSAGSCNAANDVVVRFGMPYVCNLVIGGIGAWDKSENGDGTQAICN